MLAAVCLAFALWTALGDASGFGLIESAWIFLLAGGVAVAVTVRPPARGNLVATGLLAVGVAAAMGVLLVALTSFSWDEMRWLTQRHFGMQARLVMEAMNGIAGDGADALARLEAGLDDVVGFAARYLPALLLIQSLAALAAAWALYRLAARAPEGGPLPRLAEFRFSDQMIWGVVAACALLVLPGLRLLGGNLATFFGALYIARGLAVVAALGGASGLSSVALALLGLALTLLLLPLVVFGALALGVSDTWVDWRAHVKRTEH